MKKNMLSILLATSVISSGVLAVDAYAEEAGAPEMPKFEQAFNLEQMRQKMQQKMADELGLTAEQQKQVEAMNAKSKADMEPLMKEMKDLREKMDAKRRANMEEFEKILTPEQKEKFEALKNKGPHHGEGWGKFPHHMKGKDGMKKPEPKE